LALDGHFLKNKKISNLPVLHRSRRRWYQAPIGRYRQHPHNSSAAPLLSSAVDHDTPCFSTPPSGPTAVSLTGRRTSAPLGGRAPRANRRLVRLHPAHLSSGHGPWCRRHSAPVLHGAHELPQLLLQPWSPLTPRTLNDVDLPTPTLLGLDPAREGGE
jgi:hypothetical protein